MSKKLIILLLSITAIFIVHNILITFENIISNFRFSAAKALIEEPPNVTTWIFRETTYLILSYLILSFVLFSYVLLSNYLGIFDNKIEGSIYYISIFLIIVQYHSFKDGYAFKLIKEPFFIKEKAFVYIIMILLFNVFYFYRNDLHYKFILYLHKKIKTNYLIIVILLTVFSSLQRTVSLFVDGNLLLEGDDPNTFYQQALRFFNGNYHLDTGFSPGFSFYLLIIFKIFGVGQFYPKIIMILIGFIGLLCLALFTRSFLKSKIASVIVVFFYISSSHYVSFSNQFWNENLFNPILSIFLYLSWKLITGKIKPFLYLNAFILPILIISLTFLRSWFIAILIIWTIYLFKQLFSETRRKRINICLLITSQLFFIIIYLIYFQYLGSNGYGLVTSNSSINFLIGNNPYSQGTYTRHWITFIRDFNINIDDDNYTNVVINIMTKNPMIIVENFYKKFLLWFFSAGGPRPISPFYQHPLLLSQYFYRITVFIFLIIGFSFLRKFKKGLALITVYILIFSIHMIYFADYRFTLTAMPLQAIIVVFGFLKTIRFIVPKPHARRITAAYRYAQDFRPRSVCDT